MISFSEKKNNTQTKMGRSDEELLSRKEGT